MICKVCGKNIPDGSIFCPECGNGVQNKDKGMPQQQNGWQQEPYQQQGGWQQEPYQQQGGWQQGPYQQQGGWQQGSYQQQGMPQQQGWQKSQTPPKQKRERTPAEKAKMKKVLTISIIAASVILLAVVVIVALRIIIKPKLNLNEYIEIKAEGYNTLGNAVYIFDNNKFERDFKDKLGSKSAGKRSNTDTTSLSSHFADINYDASDKAYRFLAKYVDGKIEGASGNLSNGDTVTFTWDCEYEDALKDYGVKLEYSDITYTVEGLKTVDTFDPFEGMEVSFEGMNGYGSASVTKYPTVPEADNLYYTMDKNFDLSNGDKVIVYVYINQVDIDTMEDFISAVGKIPSSTTKEFEVKGLNRYISSLSDVSDDCLKSMQKQAEDTYKASAARDFSDGETLNAMTYVGAYLLINKEEDSWDDKNCLFLVYKIDIDNYYKPEEGKEYKKTNTYYWYIQYDNLIVDSEGNTTVDVMSYYLPNNTVEFDTGISEGLWGTVGWYYEGYATLDDLYKNVVTANAENYECENGVEQ